MLLKCADKKNKNDIFFMHEKDFCDTFINEWMMS